MQVYNVWPFKGKCKASIYKEKDKAGILNSQFTSVFSVGKCDKPLIQTQHANNSISNIDITRVND